MPTVLFKTGTLYDNTTPNNAINEITGFPRLWFRSGTRCTRMQHLLELMKELIALQLEDYLEML